MTTYDKFKSIIDDIDALIAKGVTSSSPDFQAWKTKAERFLIKTYGSESYEIREFRKYHFTLSIYALGTPLYEFAEACAKDLEKVKAVFLTYLEEMQEAQDENESDNPPRPTILSSVFIVHGHDEGIKQAVARLIEKQGINAVILHEQPNKGATIIEKVEANSNVGAAICLFTADDVGRAKTEKQEQMRSRQNVVFEAGFFMGKLGRDHVILMAERGLELPSDLKGVVYTDSTSWKFDVLRELKIMGYEIDLNKSL